MTELIVIGWWTLMHHGSDIHMTNSRKRLFQQSLLFHVISLSNPTYVHVTWKQGSRFNRFALWGASTRWMSEVEKWAVIRLSHCRTAASRNVTTFNRRWSDITTVRRREDRKKLDTWSLAFPQRSRFAEVRAWRKNSRALCPAVNASPIQVATKVKETHRCGNVACG